VTASVWRRLPARPVILAFVLGMIAGCTKTLPFHDNRVFDAVPVAKMSAADLAAAYQHDPRAADREYWGKVVEITDPVAAVIKDNPAQPYVLFKQPGPIRVQAYLHDDRAAAIIPKIVEGERLTLRCFAEGLKDNVILKSCVTLK
jgi:hypothetical protein